MVFVKGNKLGKGRPKGSPNKTTLLKEERRAIFDEKMSEMFIDKIEEARPEYLLDQFLGKAEDKVKVELKFTNEEQIAELAKETAAKMKGYDTDTTTTSGA